MSATYPTDLIRVCTRCLTASCYQGVSGAICDWNLHGTPDTRLIPREQLLQVGLEDEVYLKTDEQINVEMEEYFRVGGTLDHILGDV